MMAPFGFLGRRRPPMVSGTQEGAHDLELTQEGAHDLELTV